MEEPNLKDNNVSEYTPKILRCPKCKQTEFNIIRTQVFDKEGKNPHITECAECVECQGTTIVTHLRESPHEVDFERIVNITYECRECGRQYSPNRTFKDIYYLDGESEIIPEPDWKCPDHPKASCNLLIDDPFAFDEEMA